MSAADYSYSVITDFPNHKVAPDRLTKEISDSAIVTALDYITTDGSTCNIWFKAVLSDPDEETLNAIVAAHSGEPLPEKKPPATPDGKPIISMFPTEGSRLTFVSHDWTDKTTWFSDSVRVTGATLTRDSATKYSFGHQFLIDTYHAKVWEEDDLLDGDGHSYRVKVSVDGVEKTERDPHVGTGGDFTVDYATGEATFLSDVAIEAVVTGEYHYENGSTFYVRPLAGKKFLIDKSEVQFSGNIELNDSITFETFGLVDVFAPQLVGAIPSGTLIPLKHVRYKSIKDFYNEANGAMPTYPALGGTGFRAVQQPVVVMKWDYAALLEITSAYGMEVRIYLDHHVPMGGEYASATLYGLSEVA